MKKIISYSFSLALLAVVMTACAKSTKGKVTNEWKVVSYLKNDSFTNQGGQSSSDVTSMDETSFTRQVVSSDDGMTINHSYAGAVNAHVLTIKTDGTWSLNQDLTYDYGNGDNSRNVLEQTGTWTFVGKTKGDDFKKNERLLFNVLTEKKTYTHMNNQTVVSQFSNNDTYLTGENVLIYTIKESKKKELELELVNNVSIVSTGGSNGTNTDNLSVSMTLKGK